ncbi:MAG: outer membrane protein OmpW [Gammaproteobacteria bacterium]|nr:MAG: outer membrane protein OmpW [Gammaproteobacteria bacterium]
MRKQSALSLAINAVLAGSLLLGATAAMAYQPGDFIVRAGAANVDPEDDSDDLVLNGTTLGGTEAEVDDDTQLGITFTYMINEHWGVGLLAATPFEHDIEADLQSVSLGKVDAGSTKHLPPTLTLQYFPMAADSKFQPYVGAGINYTNFFEEDVDSELEAFITSKGKMELDDSWGYAFQVGMDYQLDEHWLINASIWYLDIDTDAKIKFDNGAVIKTDVDVDPMVYMVGVGYKF